MFAKTDTFAAGEVALARTLNSASIVASFFGVETNWSHTLFMSERGKAWPARCTGPAFQRWRVSLRTCSFRLHKSKGLEPTCCILPSYQTATERIIFVTNYR